MAHQISQTDLDILGQSTQEIYLYVEILNKEMKILDEIQGSVINANFTIDANSDIRRTCDFSIYVLNSTLQLTEDSKVWIDKMFRVYLGYKHIRSNEIVKYKMGIYLPNSYSYSYSYENKHLSLSGVDLMAKFLSSHGGTLPDMSVVVKEGENIREVMIRTVKDLGHINKYIIGDIGAEITPTEDTPDPKLLPYDIELGVGSSIYDLLVELKNVWVGWEIFFDEDGTFICQLIPNGDDDPTLFGDEIWKQLIISDSNNNIDVENIKNHIVVYGETKDDGTQIKGEAKDENPDSPFAISKIGDIVDVKSDAEYEKIFSDDYARQRAEYELYLSTRLNDTVSLECVTIPWLEVNTKVSYTPYNQNVPLDFLIKTISFEASSGTSSIEMIRFYPEFPKIINY